VTSLEPGNLYCRHGPVQPIVRTNPLRVEFAQWVGLLRDLTGARGVSSIPGYVFKPPAKARDD
jgi:hypothetical protein